IKIQQRTLLAAKQLLIELGPLDVDGPPVERSTQNQRTHRDLFNGWLDDDNKANKVYTATSKAVRSVTIFNRPAILVEFNSPGSKNHFIKLCESSPNLLTKLGPN